MIQSSAFEFPPEQEKAYRHAQWLEWGSIGYMIFLVLITYFVLGSSQAMKAAWVDDILSIVAPTVFLIATRIAVRKPNERFPYGYHRAVSIAFLCASISLLGMGIWIFVDASQTLIKAEHPTIGGINVFGQTIWLGWLMLPALFCSTVPVLLLGRAKLPLARKLHDKVLFADAKMNNADWMTAAAAMVGVIGIGLGYWWTDAVAAIIISLDIIYDGYKNLSQVIFDLMDETPRSVDGSESDSIPELVENYLLSLGWVSDVKVRLREEGHVYFGEAFVVVKNSELTEQLADATIACSQLDWRIHDLVIVPVTTIKYDDKNRKKTCRVV